MEGNSPIIPKDKSYVSLLLPTKEKILNTKVNNFNDLLETLVNCRSYITGKITHMNLVNHEGVLADEFGRPHNTVKIHLGSVGIKEFVKYIKSTLIIRKNFNQTSHDISSDNLNPVLHRPWQPNPSPWMLNHQSPPPMPNPPHMPFPPVPGPFAVWPPFGLHSSQPPWSFQPDPWLRSDTERYNPQYVRAATKIFFSTINLLFSLTVMKLHMKSVLQFF